MYPNLSFFFNDLLGGHLPEWLSKILQVFNTFGVMMALAFVAAVYFLKKGLHEKFLQGKLNPITKKQIVGKPATVNDFALNGILGFFIGYKLGLFITDFSNTTSDIQAAVFSSKGNFFTGIILAAVMIYWMYAEKKKQQLDEPKEETFLLQPKDWVGEIFIRAAIGGVIGAKIFHLFEYWNDFMADPMGMLFSGAGLTFYGGLIVGTIAVSYWVIKNKINFHLMADVIAPTLMIAYAVGRMGCQLAGDGDWGIFNTAYAVNENAKVVVAASPNDYHQTFKNYNYYFVNHFGDTSQAKHLYFKGADFLPNWLFAYNYPNNVGSEGVAMKNCVGEKYCAALPLPVFPTPLYEIIFCLILFFVIWKMRNRFRHAGQVMAFYMILNGIERFLIELIRINSTYTIFGIHPTQAEIIALLLIIAGALYFAVASKFQQSKQT
jgi:phosphatidylglycerol---prolipoprotein diacylglyceryl transferase